MKAKTLLLTLLFAFSASVISFAGKVTVEKELKKEFSVNPDALLKAQSKYGSMVIENWDENKVAIFVLVQAHGSNEEKAKKILDGIDVKISGSKKLVELYTDINCKGNCNMDIDITIQMPRTMDVDLLMKYGNLSLESVDGIAKLGVKYGSLTAEDLSNEGNEIYVKYSGASLDYVKSAVIDIAYSKLSIDNSEILKIESGYNKLNIDEVYTMELKSQYDEVDIDDIYSLKMESKFTNAEIDHIRKELITTMNYGNLKVDHVEKDFNQIKLYTKYANAEIGIDEGASYHLKATAKYGAVKYPKGNAKVNVETDSYTSKTYIGTVGSRKDPKSEVSIECYHANVDLME